jgi:hypothetical protein
MAGMTCAQDIPPIGFKKPISDDEGRSPDSAPGVEAYLLRAYPEMEIPGDATLAARSGWAALNAGAHSTGAWQLIGPSKATYPHQLDPFLFDGAQYVRERPRDGDGDLAELHAGKCTLYVAAAGGGVWRTDKALNGSNWQFISASFGTNAIGALLIDSRDPSGNTSMRARASRTPQGFGSGRRDLQDDGWRGDLDAGPGSDIFFQRAIGQMALDNAGNLLVPIASAIRGISSVTSGASSSGNAGHPLAVRGLYRQTGATFTRIFTAPAPTRGSTTVKVDPTHPGIIYVNAFGGTQRDQASAAAFGAR